MVFRSEKAIARKAAIIRRDAAHSNKTGETSVILSSFLKDNRGASVAGYMPILSEINPIPAMEEAAAHGCVGLPVIEETGQPLKFSKWSPGISMKDGLFGIQVPALDNFFEPDIVILPLLGFDKRGGRLGYGGGFYDRTLEFLRKKKKILAVGFAYNVQMSETLPLETTDQLLDMLITETDLITF